MISAVAWPSGFCPPHLLLAVDPGKHHAGWALFANGYLLAAGIARAVPPKDSRPVTYRQDVPASETHAQTSVAVQIEAAVSRAIPVAPVTEVIVEGMRVYPGDKRSNPANMIEVSITSGAILGRFPLARPRLVTAARWKGQLSDGATWHMIQKNMTAPEISTARACRVYDAEDRKDFHHGLEAIGIGLWALWRI